MFKCQPTKILKSLKQIKFAPSNKIKNMQQEKQKDKMITQEIIPPGLRFYPTEEELVSFYLHNKLEDKRLLELNQVIPVINIYALEPWQLPKLAGELCNGDTEQWFFFVPRQEREARGGRPSRTTTSGYWKATGSPSYVYSSDSRVIGVKKSLVFYKGKAPTGRKTKWKMNEYRAIKEEILPCSSTYAIPKLRHEVSLCRVYVISGSFQAFDRRPVVAAVGTSRETMTVEAVHNNNNNYSSQSATMMERRSSLEIPPLPKQILFHNVDSTQARNCVMEDGGLTSLLLEWQEDEFSHHMQLP